MCVILYSKKGINKIKEDIVEAAYLANPDGAGLGIFMEDYTYIRKGFMNLESLFKFLKDLPENLKEFPCALHFRIATHGGISPVLCHPFPITSDLRKLLSLELENWQGGVVFHNGMLRIKVLADWLSDTAKLAKNLNNFRKKNWDNYIKKVLNNSRILVRLPNKEIRFFGNWFEYEGLLCSNLDFLYNLKGYNSDYMELEKITSLFNAKIKEIDVNQYEKALDKYKDYYILGYWEVIKVSNFSLIIFDGISAYRILFKSPKKLSDFICFLENNQYLLI